MSQLYIYENKHLSLLCCFIMSTAISMTSFELVSVVYSTEAPLVSTKFVHYFTLSLDKRVESEFWQQKTGQTKHYSQVSTMSRTSVIRNLNWDPIYKKKKDRN